MLFSSRRKILKDEFAEFAFIVSHEIGWFGVGAPGAPQGGSIDEYFDGTTFTADDTVARLTDFGKDFYAAQVYNNDPLGRTIVVGCQFICILA
jgi:sucrose-6-phosphate hydrolase SacC (GH32 family)